MSGRWRRRALTGALVGLGVAALGFVATVLLFALSLWDDAVHGDERIQLRAAAEALACDSSHVTLAAGRAHGCGRACRLRAIGSSATWWSSYTCDPD